MKQITPFSNGSEGFDWINRNCYQCAKAFIPDESFFSSMQDVFEEAFKQGREYPMKYHLEISMITSKMPEDEAIKMGFEQDGTWGMPRKCKEFVQRGKYAQEDPLDEPEYEDPDQLKLF